MRAFQLWRHYMQLVDILWKIAAVVTITVWWTLNTFGLGLLRGNRLRDDILKIEWFNPLICRDQGFAESNTSEFDLGQGGELWTIRAGVRLLARDLLGSGPRIRNLDGLSCCFLTKLNVSAPDDDLLGRRPKTLFRRFILIPQYLWQQSLELFTGQINIQIIPWLLRTLLNFRQMGFTVLECDFCLWSILLRDDWFVPKWSHGLK